MSVQRIQQAFERCDQRAALIPYITCGDPNAEATLAIMHEMVAAGVDVIELGVPFSDPMADGKVVQQAAERALAGGMTLEALLEVVRQFRQQDEVTPVVLMGYTNPFEAMGWEHFSQEAAAAGVDGVLMVDYPPEEFAEIKAYFDAADLAPIFLIAPTSTDERIQAIAQVAKGYVYYVSLKGVTGSTHINTEEVQERVQHIKRFVSVPVGVGFGIRDVESAQAIASVADAVVIGSKLITTMQEAIAEQPKERHATVAAEAAGQWLGEIRRGLEQVAQQ